MSDDAKPTPTWVVVTVIAGLIITPLIVGGLIALALKPDGPNEYFANENLSGDE
jgi:hypothetical protein